MKIKCKILMSIFLLAVVLSSSVWSSEELVKGYYDPENDWFVFEWERPSGKVSTIYDPPNKIAPDIKAEAVHDAGKRDYIYRYLISNHGEKQLLQDIAVTYTTLIYDATAPSSDWYIMPHYRKLNEIRWAKVGGELHGIPTGETVGGFLFRSQGIPAIVNSAFWGRERAEFSPPGDYDADDVADYFDKIYQGFKEEYKDKFKTVLLKTLGPTAPPADFKPLDFLNYIISMKHEATSLGWITNKGIEQSLDAKLEAAKKKLEQGKNDTAKNVLQAFINEVEAQGCESYEGGSAPCPQGKHLTPEAYALLRYNVLYLIERL